MKIILYTKNFNQEVREKVNVILSPEFYWIKEIKIPIKSLKEATKIAKTLFKLPQKEYHFGAIKVNNKFFAYALPKELNLKIDKKYINNIYLAQSEFYEFDNFKIENCYFKKVEDILFCFPQFKAKEIDLKEIKLTKNALPLFKSNLKFLITITILLNIIFINYYIQNKESIKELQTKKEELIKKYNLPSTMFEIDSILSNLKLKKKEAQKIKKALFLITKTPLKKDEKFIKLSYDKYFEVEIKTSRNLDSYFKKYFKVQSELKNNIYKASLYER